MPDTLGTRLRQLRKDKDWTLRQLADQTEIKDEDGTTRTLDFTFLSKVENDKEQASAKTIRALAKVLRADADELLLLGQRIPNAVREDITSTEAGRTFLRSARNLSEQDWEHLVAMVKKLRKKK